MKHYPEEEDPGTCLVQMLAIGVLVFLVILTVAFLAWCTWVAFQVMG